MMLIQFLFNACERLKYVSRVVLSMFILGLFTQMATAQNISTKNPYILIDVASGDILAEQKSNDRWYPASLTKLMTAYVTFRAIKAGEIEEGSPVVISAAARRQPPSRMGYKEGVRLRIDAALKIIIIKSANDVSLALGEAVAGSLSAFVERMNAEARRLGMVNTRFRNSNGLHNEAQYSSARDMALLSAQILREFPQYAYMFEAAAIKTSSTTHFSYNLLLERFTGANGMKTGFVCASGYNMSASATRNGRTLVAVVLGTASQTDRAVTAAQLLEKGFKSNSGLGNIFANPAVKGANPVNMRPVLCTEEVRATQYNPGAGQARINSPFLNPRSPSSKILDVRTGGITAQLAKASGLEIASRIPVPTPRPDKILDVGHVILKPLHTPSSGNLAIPTQRPQ